MDWSRAKTILIISFLVLNGLLSYQIWFNVWGVNVANKETAVIKNETTKLMESKHIQVDGKIPESIPKLQEISVQFDEKLSPNQEFSLQNAMVPGKWKDGESLEDAIGKSTSIVNVGDYHYDAYVSGDGTYVFNQMYGKYPMFDVNLTLYGKQGKITKYRQAYVEVQSAEEAKPNRVISAYEAVHSLVENYLPEGSVIKDIRLGYGQMYSAETKHMLPSWRVLMNSGEIYYVHAFTGAVETPANQDAVDNLGKAADNVTSGN